MLPGPGFSIVESVLHPTDFSESSRVAFHHALKTAMLTRSTLTLLHVATAESFDDIYANITKVKPGENLVITIFRQGKIVKIALPPSQ